MNGKLVSNWSVLENVDRLAMLQLALSRTVEVACATLIAEPSTYQKIHIGRLIWQLARAVNLVSSGIHDLIGNEAQALPASPYYATAIRSIVTLPSAGLRLDAIEHILLPDLSRAVDNHLAGTSDMSDAVTREMLLLVRQILHSAAGNGRMEHSDASWTEMALLLRRSGGVYGSATGQSDISGLASLTGPVPFDPGRKPARESIFEVVDSASSSGKAALLHSIVMGIEICAAEVCAEMIVTEAEAPWGLRFELARQVADEVRHAEALILRMEELGGELGRWPIDLGVWTTFRLADGLLEKLMIQQRIGEGYGLDACYELRQIYEDDGDPRSARLIDYITSDEVRHVRIANRWLCELLDDPTEIDALEQRVISKMVANGRPPAKCNQINVGGRLRAGFRSDELEKYRTIGAR